MSDGGCPGNKARMPDCKCSILSKCHTKYGSHMLHPCVHMEKESPHNQLENRSISWNQMKRQSQFYNSRFANGKIARSSPHYNDNQAAQCQPQILCSISSCRFQKISKINHCIITASQTCSKIHSNDSFHLSPTVRLR